jgi:hypothetical protein
MDAFLLSLGALRNVLGPSRMKHAKKRGSVLTCEQAVSYLKGKESGPLDLQVMPRGII